MPIRTAILAGLLIFATSTDLLFAQPVGTFRWQLRPFCNVLTVNVIQQTGIYTIDGTDDLCGAPQGASLLGIAFQNPTGAVGFGLTTVLPGGTAVHIEATIFLPSLNGTWRDSAGNNGTFILTSGPGGGPLRPVPSAGLPPASVTSAQIAAGAIGATHLAAGSVGGSAVAASSITGEHVLDGSLTQADIVDAPKAWSAERTTPVPLPHDKPVVVHEITASIPAPGRVILNASGTFFFPNATTIDYGICSLTNVADTVFQPYSANAGERAAADYYTVPFGGTRSFAVTAGSATFRLVCQSSGSDIEVFHPALTVLYVPGP